VKGIGDSALLPQVTFESGMVNNARAQLQQKKISTFGEHRAHGFVPVLVLLCLVYIAVKSDVFIQ
jgi:F0F1-type ATP synthase assembly protein I